MYCLEKLQRELAHFLKVDLNTLPKVQEILKAQGYSAVKKNDEITQLTTAALPQSPAPNKQSFKSFKQSLESQGIPIENEVKSFINFVEKNIYNENGVTFTQLNNALKTLNAYYKQATDPNFKSHIKNATESFLRDDIKAGIEAIFSQNKTAYKDVTSLYETALKDYANMKSTLKLVDSIKLRDIKTTHDLALDSLLKLAKGQGDELDNISTLTKALDSQNRAVIELNMLQSLFTKSLYDKDMLQVFDSGKFFDELNKLHTNTFQSKAAKDFIELAQGFHTLFKNDVLIAQSLKPTTTQAIGSSIATSIEGAVRFQFVKELFSHIIRLMPKIPFATALNEKVSGAALRYHIKSALQKSYSVSDFKNTLDSKVAKVPFDNQTRAYMRDLSKNIEKIQDEIIDYNKQLLDQEAKAQQEMAEYFAQAQAKKDEIIALKEARLGKNADEVPLDKGQDILYKPIRDTSIVLSDELPPFEAEFAVVRLSDIKPNFDNSNTQGRLIKQESVIANIVNDFKPELMFYQEGGVNGVPIITRDGKVVSGNHRSEALKQIIDSHNNATQAAREQYKKSAKEFLGVELQDNEIIVRRLKENMSDKQILQLAFSSNIGRESTMGEKALSTLSLYRQNIATLPKVLQSENVNELKSLVAKHIDKQGNGLNTFDTNLALLTSLARNGKNSNILQSLDSIKGNSEYKNKIINMYVDNAGSFYNLANNPSFKNLEFRDILSDSIYYTAKQNPTRQLDYEYLIQEIESFLNLAKDKEALQQALQLDSNKVQNLTAQAFGLALAKFSRQENPSSALYEALKQAPKALELATQPTFFTQGKALSEVDIYDFLEYLINQGQITQSQSVLSSLMPRLRELRESIANPQSSVSKVESAPQKVDSSDIIFTDKKGKEHTLTKEVQEQWRETFNLKSLDESYIPQLPQELQEAIGKEIKLTKGSLYKIVEKGREQYIPQIKETLEKPDFALKDSDDMLIIAKEIGDKQYFTSINLETNDYFISISNAPKKENILKNKVENGAKVVYQSPNAKSIFYTDTLLQEGKSPTNKIDSDIIPQMPKDNPQLVALQTKIQQSRQQIAESKNPDKEYLYQVFKPDEIIELEKQYFNQAMPQEYKELIQDFPRLYEQSLANELKTYAKDADAIQEVTTQLLNDFKDKPFKDTAKHAELLLFNTLRDKAQELGFKELDINKPSFKVAFGKFQAKLKKGDIQDLSEHITTSSLRKNRLRIEQSLNIKPLAEFGENYAEHYHSGESAIAKLLNEKQGQVSGAFYRKELGDIDLVWGEVTDLEKHKGYGLAHILDKRKAEFMQQGLSEAEAEAKAMELINNIPNIISKGKIIKDEKGRFRIELDNQILGIKDNWHGTPTNKWIITTYEPRESAGSLYTSPTITKGETLPLNSKDIIPQTPQEIIKQAKQSGKSVAETKELLQKNKELRAKPTKPKEYIKIDYHQQHYTTKDLEKLEAMLQDRQEVLKNINEKISYYKAKTDEIKARNADDEKKYNDLYFSTAETDEATREAIWQQMKAIKENNAAFLKQNQRIVDTYFGYQRKANKIESEIEFLQDKITKLEAPKVDSSVESTPPKHTQTQPTQKGLFDEVDSSVESHTKHQDYNTFNQSLKDAHDFFKANNKDAYNDKLFDDVIKVANALDIRFWYQPNAVYMAGSYTYRLNRIMLQSDNFSKENAKTMLHELIHSVTSRAIYAYDNKALREKLSEKQIEAITELKNLYKEVSENNADKVWQKMATFKDELENNKEGKLYGLKNEHEMLAELANPSFREFLKEQNIFSKIIEAMAKIFSYVKDKLTGESIKSTNAQSELETILYKIMDNYTNPHAFTNEMSEHFGSRNFVDTARYKEYIKDHKQKFDKDNYKGKHTFSFTEGMDFYNRSAISGKERFFQNFINNAYFDEKDFDIVQKLKWQMMDPVKRPANFMELKTEKNAHIFEEVEKTHENNIKSLVKEYYGVSYDEFNNAFNGAMKDKHFYEVKNATPQEMLRDKTSTEATFLLALKPYFTSGLYKLLNEADFNVIKDSLYRILQDENLTYRNKPINEWFAKEWVEQDVKALQESFQYKLEQIQGQKVDSTPTTLNAQEAKELLESKQGERLPKELDIQGFLNSLDSVKNKENFITHLQKKDDAQSRLAYLHIIEPTLKHPDLELTKGGRKTKIKVFNDGENFYSFLIADLVDKRLFTFLPKARKGYIETKIKNADLIQTFTSQASKDQEPNGLAREIIPQESTKLQSNAHLGSGLVGGSVSGVEQDENGNLTFSPEKFVLGLLGGAVGSKAVTQGFKYLKENPQVKEAVVKELADTLALGFDKARQKYPLLSLLEPRYIVQNERGRKIQAKSMLKEAQEKALKQEREAIEKVLSGSTQKAEILKDLDNADEILAVILKGYQKGQKGKGAEHIRLEHTLDTTQEGYLTQNEVLNMGVKMREFIEKYGEPFIETNDKGMKSRIYEWEKNNTRFRIVAGIRAKEGNIAPFPLADEIITFYSDRNLKEKMNFKNPALKETIIDVKKNAKGKRERAFLFYL